MASRTASAPWPASAGLFFTRSPSPWPGMRGRWSNMVNRVVRSTGVPTAELPRPRIRSPSQCPGTARSATSAGRSLIMTSGVTCDLPRPRHPRHPQRPAGPQARGQLAPQRAAPLYVQRLVDGLVADAHRLIARKVEPQPSGNLLGAPRLAPPAVLPAPLPGHHRPANRGPARTGNLASQPVLNILPQRRVHSQLRWLRPTRRPLGMPLRRCRPILQAATARGRVAPQFTRDRRGIPPQPPGRLPHPTALRPQQRVESSAFNPRARQTTGSALMMASTMAQVSSVAYRPLPGTSGPLPPATRRPQAPSLHSTGPRQSLPRTDGGSRAEPRLADQVTASIRVVVPDPTAVAHFSSQPPHHGVATTT